MPHVNDAENETNPYKGDLMTEQNDTEDEQKPERVGSFSEGWSELPAVTMARRARNAIFDRLKPLACAGDRKAKKTLRQTMRLRAIWDDKNGWEVRL